MAFPAVADPIYLCAKWLLVSPTRIYTCSTVPTQIGRTHPHSRIYRLTPNGVFSRRKKFDMDAASLIERKPLDHIDEFQPGDTVIVNLRIVEGDRRRIQAFQGNVISGKHTTSRNPSPGDTFIVRRVSYGIGVERIIPFHSPNLESLKVSRRGKVRRSRLYYLRGLTGRKARIKERR